MWWSLFLIVPQLEVCCSGPVMMRKHQKGPASCIWSFPPLSTYIFIISLHMVSHNNGVEGRNISGNYSHLNVSGVNKHLSTCPGFYVRYATIFYIFIKRTPKKFEKKCQRCIPQVLKLFISRFCHSYSFLKANKSIFVLFFPLLTKSLNNHNKIYTFFPALIFFFIDFGIASWLCFDLILFHPNN